MQEFTCRVAKTLEEAKELIEAEVHFVTDMDGKKLFGKLKYQDRAEKV
jgi:hypothetical protein